MSGANWKVHFQTGKRYLKRHANEVALRHFERALDGCPVSRKRELSEILYFLGSTLVKLGMTNCALKSWTTARMLYKQGYASHLIARFANEYGMARQASSGMDDWKAFFSVQLRMYLQTKRTGKIGTDAERDMIGDLIADGFRSLRASYRMKDLSPAEKLELFRNARLVFPLFHVPTQVTPDTIPVDFTKQSRISADDPCFCGSGLEYKLCCGRIPGEEELLSGII